MYPKQPGGEGDSVSRGDGDLKSQKRRAGATVQIVGFGRFPENIRWLSNNEEIINVEVSSVHLHKQRCFGKELGEKNMSG